MDYRHADNPLPFSKHYSKKRAFVSDNGKEIFIYIGDEEFMSYCFEYSKHPDKPEMLETFNYIAEMHNSIQQLAEQSLMPIGEIFNKNKEYVLMNSTDNEFKNGTVIYAMKSDLEKPNGMENGIDESYIPPEQSLVSEPVSSVHENYLAANEKGMYVQTFFTEERIESGTKLYTTPPSVNVLVEALRYIAEEMGTGESMDSVYMRNRAREALATYSKPITAQDKT